MSRILATCSLRAPGPFPLGAVLVLLAGGVGAATPVSAKADEPIEVRIQDNRFVPDRVELPAGRKARLRIVNDGTEAEEFESTDLNREKIVRPGSSIIIFLPPLEPGEYGFFGEFHADTARGTLVVK